MCLWQHRGMLGLKGTVAGQSWSFPTCPCASPVPAILCSGAVIILPLATMSGLHISMLEPLIKPSTVCCQHDTESHQDQHRHLALVPCPTVTHCAQLPAPPNSPQHIPRAYSLQPRAAPDELGVTKDHPFTSPRSPGMLLHLELPPGWRRHMGPHVGLHQWSQTRSCLQGMLKSIRTPPEVWDRALPPVPLRGIDPRGAPCPCSQSAFGHAVRRASRPWLSCAERSLMDGWSNAHPGQERLCTSPDS